MPCFQGLAVSIHTADGPIAEHSIQRQQKYGRIATYIPVPPPKVGPDGSPRQSTFAVSITLLTPGMQAPYSTPKPTFDNPYPQPQIVGGLPGTSSIRGQYNTAIRPYVPHTTSPNETVAAYIYFDGRQKEEVATLLRKGEETWVNSRWVSIPEHEGGGIAEREFLFREVGLERWLNGLDLSASAADKAKKIERRQKKLEKKRHIKKEEVDSDDDAMTDTKPRLDSNGLARQQGDPSSPVQPSDNDRELDLSPDSSDDEPPEPEASGQIKVALFRVLASGEIKRGEYSPQFDVHDDEGVDGQGGDQPAGENVDHTTSFAKPKTLDPKSISTQTVTGLDPPESPFAVFTFFYRGEKQLQKMGILPSSDVKHDSPSTAKRKSVQTDFSKLGPLKNTGTKGFSSYREKIHKAGAKDEDDEDDDAMDSDNDRLPLGDRDDNDDDAVAKTTATPGNTQGKDSLSAEDAMKSDEVAEGLRKIKLKRQHSVDANLASAQYPSKSPGAPRTGNAPGATVESPTGGTSTPDSLAATAGTPNDKPQFGNFLNVEDDGDMGMAASPLKKQRGSFSDLGATLQAAATGSTGFGAGHAPDTATQSSLNTSSSAFADSITSPNASGGSWLPPHSGPTSQTQAIQGTSGHAKQIIAAATALPDEDEEL